MRYFGAKIYFPDSRDGPDLNDNDVDVCGGVADEEEGAAGQSASRKEGEEAGQAEAAEEAFEEDAVFGECLGYCRSCRVLEFFITISDYNILEMLKTGSETVNLFPGVEAARTAAAICALWPRPEPVKRGEEEEEEEKEEKMVVEGEEEKAEEEMVEKEKREWGLADVNER